MKQKDLPTCPMCKEKYKGFPAISRADGKTKICPECGIAEALVAYNKAKEVAKKEVVEEDDDYN